MSSANTDSKEFGLTWVLMIAIGALLANEIPVSGEVFYVKTDGDNTEDGHTEAKAVETISKAVYLASQNMETDTIYVKTGNYDRFNDEDAEAQTGTNAYSDADGIVIAEDDLQVIGYSSTTGDLDNGEGIPSSYDQFNSRAGLTSMPKLLGENRASNTGITINADNLTIRNIEIKDFTRGIRGVLVDGASIKNVIGSQFGDTAAESGYAIRIDDCEWFEIRDCVFVNATHAAISFVDSSFNVVSDCKLYADDNSTAKLSSQDYYIVIAFNSTYNTVLRCEAERHNQIAHGGHAYAVEALAVENATANYFQDCKAKNIAEPFVLRGAGSTYNTFLKCESIGDPLDPLADGCITLSGGPRNNTFRSVRLAFAQNGISVFADGKWGIGSTDAGSNNTFTNCIIEIFPDPSGGFAYALNLNFRDKDETQLPAIVYNQDKQFKDNTFRNCTFVAEGANDLYFINSDRESSDNLFENCIVAHFTDYASYELGIDGVFGNPTGEDTYFEPGFTFNYCCFDNPGANGFPALSVLGANNNSNNAPFVSNDGLYNLSADFNGTSLSTYFQTDYAPPGGTGDSRPAGLPFDIGAQEYIGP